MIKVLSFIILFFIFFNGKSQKPSSDLLPIINNSELNVSEKQKLLDSVLTKQFNEIENETYFLNTYEVIKWKFGNGYLDETIKLNKRNLFLMDSLNYPKNPFYRKNNYSLAYYELQKENTESALKYFSRVISLDSTDKLALYSLDFSAKIYYKNHDYHIASGFYEEIIKLAKKLNHVGYVTNASLYASICYKKIKTKKSFVRGIKLLKKAIELKKKRNDDITNIYYIETLNSLYRHIGNLYMDREDYNLKEAKKNFDIALKYAKLSGDSLRLADIHHEIGSYYIYDNVNPKGLKYLNKSLSYKPDFELLTYIYKSKSRYYYLKKDLYESGQQIDNALKTQIPNLKSTNFSALKININNALDKFELLDLLINKAIVLKAKADIEEKDKETYTEALKYIEMADDLLDELRLNTNEFKTKLFWKNIFSELYTVGVSICFEMNDIDKAFYFMEKNKSILLREDIDQQNRVTASNLPKDILDEYHTYKKDIYNSSQNNSADHKKILANQKFNEFIKNLPIEYQTILKNTNSIDVLTLDGFKNKIENNNKAYIHYIIHDNFLSFENKSLGYGLLITKDTTSFFKLNDVEKLKKLITDFKSKVNQPLKNKLELNTYNTTAHNLHNILLPNTISKEINNKILTIIPDNIIQNIPFEALVVSKDLNEFLITKNEINYAYSLSFLNDNSKDKKNNSSKDAIGFAPIIFENGLPNLEHTEKEINQLKIFKKYDLYKYKEANKKNFKQKLNDYKIIHVSTHADFNKYNEPFFILSDSIMTLNELYGLKNSADLVVLSACETANGELYKGEGVMSLTRGFFNTGARSVASTLWTVNDKTTSSIMQSFYKNLKSGQTKSKALHNAKLEYVNIHSLSETSPYYWASFILVGDAGVIGIERDYTIVYILGIVFIVFLFILFLKKNKKLG